MLFYRKSLLLAGIISMFFFASCEKEKMESQSPEGPAVESAESMTMADEEFTDIFEFVDGAQVQGSSDTAQRQAQYSRLPDCANLTFSQEGDSWIMTIDFGTEGCECEDGKVRKGRIVTEFQGNRFTAGSTRNSRLEDYYVNGHKVTGKSMVTVESVFDPQSGTNYKVSRKVSDASVTVIYTDEQGEEQQAVLEWTSERTFEYKVNNYGNIGDFKDDELVVTGTASGTNFSGESYQATIDEPLVRTMQCAYDSRIWNFIKGKVTIQSGDRSAELDYGDGACDALINIISNGESKEIRIGRRWNQQ